MKKLQKPTLVEKTFDNVAVQTAITGLSIFSGNPIASLLPVLSGSLASGRHKKRIEDALGSINDTLLKHEEKIREITDAQYKLINETILTVLQTTESDKIAYLRNAIENSIETDINDTMASLLSRIIRDISSEEIKFLNKNISYKKILFMEDSGLKTDLYIKPQSHESTIAAGLISLGVLLPADSTIDNISTYTYSELAEKLLAIVT